MTPEIPIEKFEIFAMRIDHPECIAFDRKGDLWAGGESGQIYRIPPDGNAQLVTSMGGFCGGVGFLPKEEHFTGDLPPGVVKKPANNHFFVFSKKSGRATQGYPALGLF